MLYFLAAYNTLRKIWCLLEGTIDPDESATPTHTGTRVGFVGTSFLTSREAVVSRSSVNIIL